jgi:hypothetical protein
VLFPVPLGKKRIGAAGAAPANAQKQRYVVYIACRRLITSPRNGQDTNTWPCLPVFAVDLLPQSMCFGEKACELDLLLDHRQRRLQPTHFVVRGEGGHLRRRYQWIVLHTSRSLKSATELSEQAAAAVASYSGTITRCPPKRRVGRKRNGRPFELGVLVSRSSREDRVHRHSRRASFSMLAIVDAKTPVAITSRIIPQMVLSTDASSMSRHRGVGNERAVPRTAL